MVEETSRRRSGEAARSAAEDPPRTRLTSIALLLLSFAAGAGALWFALRLGLLPLPVPPGERPPEDRLVLEAASFAELPGWREDRLAAAVPAFRRSCDALARRPDGHPLTAAGAPAVGGTAGDWRGICDAAAALPEGDETAARAFFEANFLPLAVSNRAEAEGLFTGYYEPTLAGSRHPGGRFRVPLYARPPELVSADLGAFRDELAGRRLAGRVEDGRLVPFDDRLAIEAGTLAGRGLELAWVADPVAAFFLHIQGSGRVELEDGGVLRVGYAGQNGHPYVAIGRELVTRGEMTLEEVSMQSIRRWLAGHPEQAAEVMAANPSYVFFRELPEEGPVGSLGVVLSPGRSLAVDARFLPVGAPLWLAAEAPGPVEGDADVTLRRLLVAQDTGGAIRGPVRGDVFFGHGDEAASVAGRMKHPGRLWLLLPRTLAAP